MLHALSIHPPTHKRARTHALSIWTTIHLVDTFYMLILFTISKCNTLNWFEHHFFRLCHGRFFYFLLIRCALPLKREKSQLLRFIFVLGNFVMPMASRWIFGVYRLKWIMTVFMKKKKTFQICKQVQWIGTKMKNCSQCGTNHNQPQSKRWPLLLGRWIFFSYFQEHGKWIWLKATTNEIV